MTQPPPHGSSSESLDGLAGESEVSGPRGASTESQSESQTESQNDVARKTPTASELLPVIYRDEWLVAIDKPPGWLVHRTSIARDVRRFVIQELRNQLGQRVYPVHRLDRPTSGILLFGLDPDSARAVVGQFEQRRVVKRYLAIVRGFLDDAGRIEHALKDTDDRFDREHSGRAAPREAVTEYQTLHRAELSEPVGRYQTARYSLVRLSPHTGRRHQLRRHLRHLSHPIVGDRTYGDRDHNAFFARQHAITRMLLAAHEMQLHHPVTGQFIGLRSELDAEFQAALALIGSPWRVSVELADPKREDSDSLDGREIR